MAAEVVVGRALYSLAVALALASCQTLPPDRTETQSSRALALVAQAQYELSEGRVERGLQLFAEALRLDPTSPELREEYGLALAGGGIRDQALAVLRQATALSPEGEAVLGLLAAQAAGSREELEEAVKHLERGLDFGPYSDRVRQNLIEAYLRLGQGEKAWGLVEPLLADHPESPWLHLVAGQALRQMGRLPEAASHLEQARKSPDFANQATGELVDVLAQQRKYKEAAELVGEAVRQGGAPTLPGLVRWATLLMRARDDAKAEEVLNEALARDPNFTDALILRAAVAFRQGKADEAEHFYQRALAVAPEDPDAVMGLARLYLELRRFDQARELLQKARRIVASREDAVPGAEGEVIQEQAALELMARAYDRALPFLEELAKKPLDRRSVALWGEYFRGQGQNTEGLNFFQKAAVESDPQAAMLVRAIKAEFLLGTGQKEDGMRELSAMASGSVEEARLAISTAVRAKLYDRAVSWARQALERFPGDGELTFSLAASLERSKRVAEAEKVFRELIAAEPDNASALNYLGYMFADRGENLAEAKELIEKAVALDPLSGAYLDSLGWVYFRLGDWDRAEKYLTQAVALEPFDATVHEHLGDLYQARGQVDKAREAWERALSLKPDEEGQEERIKAKLAGLPHALAP
ncbi:MAG: tetratricopeptide repeat protein [Thermoanaerobaculum sp.]